VHRVADFREFLYEFPNITLASAPLHYPEGDLLHGNNGLFQRSAM